MQNIGLMGLNPHEQKMRDNELEDLQLPPLTTNPDYGDYLSYSDGSNPFCEQDSFFYTNIDDYSDTSIDIEKICYIEDNITTDIQVSESKKERPNKTNDSDLSKTLKKCCFCHKKVMLKTMFVVRNHDSESFVCLKCSVNIWECRKLKDWENEPNSVKTNICSRCHKVKSYYRFTNKNKYCDYCLLKKRWLRLRTKIDNNDESEFSKDDEDDISSKTIINQFVRCCLCDAKVNIQECFLFFTCFDDLYSDKKICLDCSLNIKDWRCLRDWEDSSTIKDGRMCSRCKKMKSKFRFKSGKSGCGYCSLKRKRLYLLQKQYDC